MSLKRDNILYTYQIVEKYLVKSSPHHPPDPGQVDSLAEATSFLCIFLEKFYVNTNNYILLFFIIIITEYYMCSSEPYFFHLSW